MKLDDLGGADGKDRDFLTTSLLLEWNSWNLAISHTGRDTEEADGSDFDDLFAQAIHSKAFKELSKTASGALIRKFEHDVSDHMPIWIRLPLP